MNSNPTSKLPCESVKLGDVVEVRAGHQPPKDRLQTALNLETTPGAACLLSPRNLEASGELIDRDLQVFSLDEKALVAHSLIPGDVLLQCKGSVLKAYYFRNSEGSDRTFFAGPTFLRLRIAESSDLRPGFLAWYLNHKATQGRLEAFKKGSAMTYISAKSVNDFEVSIPSQEVQLVIEKVETEFFSWQAVHSNKADAMQAWVDSSTWHALGESNTDG